MKKRLLLTLIILILIIGCGVVWYMMPSRFLGNVSADDIKFIHVFNGNNGSSYTIGDKEQISYIVDNIQKISFKKAGISLGRKGYQYRLTFEDADGKIVDKFIINSSDTLRNDPFFYRDKNNSICAEYIGNILLSDFHGIDLSEEQSFLATVLEETTTYMIVEPVFEKVDTYIGEKVKVEYGTDHYDYLYGVGRKVVIYYKGNPEETADGMKLIKSDDISTEGFREFELEIKPSNEKVKKEIVERTPPTDSSGKWWTYGDAALYYYGVENVLITIKGWTMPLEKALEEGRITLNGIIANCNQDVTDGAIDELVYKDGGSQVYKYPDYTIIKYHTLDGNRDVYIGSPDMDIEVANK